MFPYSLLPPWLNLKTHYFKRRENKSFLGKRATESQSLYQALKIRLFLNKKVSAIKIENKTVVVQGEGIGRVAKMGTNFPFGTQEVPTSNYKINKSRECNIQHGEYSQ